MATLVPVVWRCSECCNTNSNDKKCRVCGVAFDKVDSNSASPNTGSPKLLIDIEVVDRAVCVKRGWGFDTNELDLMKILFPIIDQQLQAGA